MSFARDPLGLHYDFDQLSITDLLRARDTYHFHGSTSATSSAPRSVTT